MKCLVTGGCGFIGSHIVDKLVELGQEVTVIDNHYADNEKFYYNEKAQYVSQDICNYQMTRVFYTDVDWVFHCAAESRIGPAIENPLNATNINVTGTCTVLQCAREAGVKAFVYSSTSSGYGNNPYPNVETQPDDCLNPYSVSKVAAEKLCKLYTEMYGLPTVVLRYFNVYGERAPRKGQYAPVIGIFKRQKDAGEPLTIVGDGLQRRDFVHVSDVVNANIRAAAAVVDPSCYGQMYNIGSGENFSIKEIADWIDHNQVHIPARVGEVRVSLANIEKFQNAFNWEPNIKLDEWVKENAE
tara:strand:- start:1441 stop:2337 length:897 start_codon:yes stop_codon:yes gene_type:complete